MSKFTTKVYPRLRRDYDSLVQQFSPGFAEAFERLDSPIGNDPQVQEIIRLQSELGESFWRAGILIAGTMPKDERAQELDRIERKLKTTGWPYASFARPSRVADFEFKEYRREVKRLWQINQRLVSCCSSALKARPKKHRPVSRTAKLEWPDFQAMINKSQAFDFRFARFARAGTRIPGPQGFIETASDARRLPLESCDDINQSHGEEESRSGTQ